MRGCIGSWNASKFNFYDDSDIFRDTITDMNRLYFCESPETLIVDFFFLVFMRYLLVCRSIICLIELS